MREFLARYRALRAVRLTTTAKMWSNVRCGTREPYLTFGDLRLALRGVRPHVVRLRRDRGALPDFVPLIDWMHNHAQGFYCLEVYVEDEYIGFAYAFTDPHTAFQFKMRWA